MDFMSYREHLNRMPLSDNTRRTYANRVKLFLDWLESSPEKEQALTNATTRDFALRDYKVWLLQSGAKPATVNASLASLDNFFVFIGLGKAKVRRQDLPNVAPRALEPEELRRVLKVIAHCASSRNRTIALLMLYSGLRVSEVAALNVGDVFLTARKGEIVVRNGKGNKHRLIPMNAELREIVQSYMTTPRASSEPLFVSRRGSRISTGAIEFFVRQIARDANVQLTCHTFRHTMITKLIRSGSDIVTVAEVAGHGRLETTRRYSLPSMSDKIATMEKLNFNSAS